MQKLNLVLAPDKYAQVYKALRNLQHRHSHLFDKLFQKNEIIQCSDTSLLVLSEFEIVSGADGFWSSNYSIYKLGQLFIMTDSFLLPRTDRVFPLSEDESFFLASKVDCKKGDTVLDVGTGSGIYAMTAASKGASVVAVDINHRALNFARFNSMINGLSDNIEFLESNIFSNLTYHKFDRIICNPAIIPAAPDSGFFIHSDGGIDGTRMSFKLLKQFPKYLFPGGKLQMLATSFTTAEGSLIIEDFIRREHNGKNIRFTIQNLYSPSLESLTSLTSHFSGCDGYAQLTNHIDESKYSALRYLYIIAEEGLPFEIIRKENDTVFIESEYSGHWPARLKRLFMVFPQIAGKKIHERFVNAFNS